MGEFELIRRYFLPLAGRQESGSLILGPGDDCAIQRIPAGRDLVFSVDALVEGVHFPRNYRPDYLGWRALAAAASDLAAMGAKPLVYLLALSLPNTIDIAWLELFANGLKQDQINFGINIIGGDTSSTPGPTSISVTMLGRIKVNEALKQSNAKIGDDIWKANKS